MAQAGGSVVAFVTIPTEISLKFPLKTGEKFRIVRVEAGGFECIHAVHGKVCSLDDSHYFIRVLRELVNQSYLEVTEEATVETGRTSSSLSVVYSHIWVMIHIKREYVELVSTRITSGVFLSNRVGGLNSESDVFSKVYSQWKDTSKQICMRTSGAELSPPADVIKLKLYEHQKQGLRWMVDREELQADDDDELPPFWEEKDGVYRAEFSSFITLKRPQNVRGGILADASGMGKTLTLLSLIAYTKQISSSACASSADADLLRLGNVRKKRKIDSIPVEEDVNFEWRPTLVVCPPSVLAIWKEQIEKCTWAGSLKVCSYYGKSKTKDPHLLMRHDIVLTTYNVVDREEETVLNKIEWWRVILDDAHVLKLKDLNLFSDAKFACLIKLKAKRRWAVTGKHVQKDYENYELYYIMAFLQVQPFCDKTVWKRLFNRYCSTTLRWRLGVLMTIFSLQREMPVSIENSPVVLSKDERDLCNSMEAEAKKAAKSGHSRSLQAAVLHLWHCCNGLALFHLSCAEMAESNNFQDLSRKPDLLKKWITALREDKDYDCPICMHHREDMVITRCTHLFCSRCIMQVLDKHGNRKSPCPMCRVQLTKRDIFCAQRIPLPLTKKIDSLTKKDSSSVNMSSKVSALLNLLLKSSTENPNRKTVVLSQFRRMLMLVDGVLSEAGFNVRYMDVIDNAKRKAETVKEFCNAEPPVVLLTTFKALSNNSPGLDLSAASNVYLMEPCWNAHTEEEALCCICRPGRKERAKIVRLVCKNSIEERILEMRKHDKVVYGSSNSTKEVNLSELHRIKHILGL